jgi:hypothetical protein
LIGGDLKQGDQADGPSAVSGRRAGLVRPEAIDEFRAISTAPDLLTTRVEALRRADERTELEPALMRIAGEIDETPHGPTEIADITTAHLRVLGDAAFAGIVIKGRASAKVRSKDVADQLQRAAELPGVRLLVLAAVGDIQDDAKKRLAWLADRVGADWLILDRGDLARLFVAYAQLCPNDGNWIAGEPCPSCGYRRRRYRQARAPFTILTLEDVSTAAAKRFGVHILVPPDLSEDEIEARVRSAIPDLRSEGYSRNEQVEQRHGDRLADVVFLYVYEDISDRPHANWIVRAQWISPDLDDRVSPMRYGQPDAVDPALTIDWNSSYDAIAAVLANRLDKGTYLREVDQYLANAALVVSEARPILDAPVLSPTAETALGRLANLVDRLEGPDRSKAPPHELSDLDDIFEALTSDLLNLALPFGERGQLTWPDVRTRQWLGRQAIERYDVDLTKMKFEREKVR